MRVVVADDVVILREGLSRLLEEAGFEVVGLAADADSCTRSSTAVGLTWRSSISACPRLTRTKDFEQRS